ncbi:Uncharacterised protein [Mycobacterium tuberculosis]|nr:Uncharacterised protein [Mycobacterium tuberculosis]
MLVVEAESLLGLGEQPLGVHVFGKRGPAIDAEWDFPVVVDVSVRPGRVWSGDQGHQIGAHPRGSGEGVYAVCRGQRRAVGDHLPVRGRGHPHVKRGLEVGLVEAGEHALGVGGFELRVQVGLAVHRIDKPMQALAGIGVVAVGVDDDDVALGQSAQRDPGRLVISRDVQVLVVEAGAAHGVGGDVDDRVGAGECVEHHGGGRPEGAFAGSAVTVGHIENDLVAVHGYQGGAFDGLVPREVWKGHGVQLNRVGGNRCGAAVVVLGGVLTAADSNERTAPCSRRPPRSLSPISGSIRCARGAGSRRAGSSRWQRSATSR